MTLQVIKVIGNDTLW